MIPSAARDGLADAFWQLVRQHEVDKISVTDIAKTRSITRQAFYYHFQSLDDLVEYAINRYVERLADRIMPMRDVKKVLMLAFSPAQEHPETIKRLSRSRKYPANRIIYNAVAHHMDRILLDRRVTRDLGYDATEMAVRFYTGALLNVIAGACQQSEIHTGWMADQYVHLLRGDLLPKRKEQPPI